MRRGARGRRPRCLRGGGRLSFWKSPFTASLTFLYRRILAPRSPAGSRSGSWGYLSPGWGRERRPSERPLAGWTHSGAWKTTLWFCHVCLLIRHSVLVFGCWYQSTYPEAIWKSSSSFLSHCLGDPHPLLRSWSSYLSRTGRLTYSVYLQTASAYCLMSWILDFRPNCCFWDHSHPFLWWVNRILLGVSCRLLVVVSSCIHTSCITPAQPASSCPKPWAGEIRVSRGDFHEPLWDSFLTLYFQSYSQKNSLRGLAIRDFGQPKWLFSIKFFHHLTE